MAAFDPDLAANFAQSNSDSTGSARKAHRHNPAGRTLGVAWPAVVAESNPAAEGNNRVAAICSAAVEAEAEDNRHMTAHSRSRDCHRPEAAAGNQVVPRIGPAVAVEDAGNSAAFREAAAGQRRYSQKYSRRCCSHCQYCR